MDEGAGMTVYDASDNSNDGTLTNGPKWTTDSPSLQGVTGGGSLNFDGVDDYVDMGNDGSLKPTATASWFMWVKSSDGMTTEKNFIRGDGNNLGYILGAGWTSGKFRAWIYDTAYRSSGDSTTSIVADTWYFVGATYDKNAGSNQLKLYVNGVLENSGTATGDIYWSSENIYIGAWLSYYFDFSIDNVQIYNRALSAEEIRYHYNRGKPIAHWKFDEGNGMTAYDSAGNNDSIITKRVVHDLNGAENSTDMTTGGMTASYVTDKKEGTYSTQATYPASSTSWRWFSSTKNYGDISAYVVDENYFQFWMYLQDESEITFGEVEFGNTQDGPEYHWSNAQVKANNLVDGWNLISLKFGDAVEFGGTVDWSTGVDHFRIYLKSTGSNSTIVLKLDDLRISSEPTWTNGKYSSAIDLDGLHDYIRIENSDSLQISNEFTAGGWFRFDDNTNGQMLFAKGKGGSTWNYYLSWDITNGLRFLMFCTTTCSGGGSSSNLYYFWTPETGRWYHIMESFDNANDLKSIYIDGIQVASAEETGTILTDSNVMMLGARALSDESPEIFLNGQIDDFRFYDYARSADEIRLDHNNGL